jgi:hypothetical protein
MTNNIITDINDLSFDLVFENTTITKQSNSFVIGLQKYYRYCLCSK